MTHALYNYPWHAGISYGFRVSFLRQPTVRHRLHANITLRFGLSAKCSRNLNFPSPPHVSGLNILMTLWMTREDIREGISIGHMKSLHAKDI